MIQNQMFFESDEEDILFVSKQASPIPHRKLKRLKKERAVPNYDAKKSIGMGDPMDHMNDAESESYNKMFKTSSQGLHDEEEEWIGQHRSCNLDEAEKDDDVKEEDDIADSHMEIESPKAAIRSSKISIPEACNDNELENPVSVDEHVVEATQNVNKSASISLEEKKKKKRRKESKGKSKEASRSPDAEEKCVLKKKKSALEEIHVESQRLLRETLDASFRPQPAINKPISSVLEKIRLRKLQLEKKAGKRLSGVSKESGDDDTSPEDVSKDDLDMKSSDDDVDKRPLQVEPQIENKEKGLEEANFIAPLVNENGIPRTPENCGETSLPEKAKKENIPNIFGGFRVPLEDTQDLFCNSQLSSGEDLEENLDDSTQDNEDVAPALLSMSLKLDSHPDEEELFDEDDKENVDPLPSKPAEESLYSKGAPVKALVDDEAEDEDEDLLVGHFEEDDSDGDENEDSQDIVATAEEEQPIDQSKRDELHRKWLEQQDAAATSDILLRLGGNWKQRGHHVRKTALFDELDDIVFDDHGDEMVECDDKRGHCSSVSEESKHGNGKSDMGEPPLRTTVADDHDDVFVSSEDEEVEERLMRVRVLQESEQQEVFLTPADDETSREIFGLIKKVNIAPNSKKKPKLSSVFHEIIGSGGNSNGSSKSSFLGRTTSASLQISHKQGLGGSKSYIFGRDDSNSRHAISKAESQEDVDQKENEHPTNNLNIVSSTQRKFKRNVSGNKAAKDSNCGNCPSLFEILRRQTSELDRTLQSRNTNGTEGNRPASTMSHFAAFKSFTSIKTLKRTG